MAEGARAIGHKIGLASRAGQVEASNTTEPDYGVMLDDALYRDGATVPADRFIGPRLEVELAFVLSCDLSGPACGVHDVLAATAVVTPATEIVDWRTEVPRAVADTIADNAAFGAIVLGGSFTRPGDVSRGDVTHVDFGPWAPSPSASVETGAVPRARGGLGKGYLIPIPEGIR